MKMLEKLSTHTTIVAAIFIALPFLYHWFGAVDHYLNPKIVEVNAAFYPYIAVLILVALSLGVEYFRYVDRQRSTSIKS